MGVNFFKERDIAALVLLVALYVCIRVCMCVTLAYEQLRSNFKWELLWLPNTQSTKCFFV